VFIGLLIRSSDAEGSIKNGRIRVSNISENLQRCLMIKYLGPLDSRRKPFYSKSYQMKLERDVSYKRKYLSAFI